MRRRAILIAVPVAVVALIIGAISGSPDSNQAAVTKAKPTAAELQEIEAKQLAREDRGIDRLLDFTTFVAAGQGKKRQVALTFDDGPSVFTPEILRILKQTGTHGTFFVVGSMIPDQERMIQKIMREGNAIGNHTVDHPRMGELSAGDQLLQLNEQAALMDGAGGPVERLFRPPYRSFNGSTLELLAERDMLMVLWDVDTGDYEGLSSDEIARNAVDDAKPGSIILMHDGGGDRTNTVAALPEIIKGLKRRKLEPVTVPRLVLDDPPTDAAPLPEGLSGN
ncbi:MAG: polysaccharide deacetylase family protein [Solirubrobacterales bacterium]|nr:polysaccharide deacetylase family protein [Solirubrobacterales bacterium]